MEKHRLDEEIEYYRTNDPNDGGLERLKYVRSRPRRRGQRQPQQVRYNDNWANPDVGWSSEEMRDQLVGAGQRDLTPETLLLLSAYVYPHGDAPPHLQVPPNSGWKVIATYADLKGTGYYAMALYHERSNAVVIVNRGTEFPDGVGNLLAAGRDLGADYELFRKRLPAQMHEARTFIHNVNRILRSHPEIYRKKHRQGVVGQEAFPSFVVTGHSLGGAAAQMQIATAATELRELKIRGVTFAAVGVASALFENKSDWQYARRVRLFADSRLINYIRRGDGVANRRNQWFQRPERIGRDRQLAGLQMDEIEAREQRAERQEGGRGIAGATGGSTAERALLLGPYQRNHSLLSYYDRQFATSLDQLIPRY
jgi:Lipase (class 3)